MARIRLAGFLFLLPVVLGLASCATRTTMETNWVLPGAEGEAFRKLAVIGILRHDKESTAFESAVAEKFDAKGVKTIPGFTFMEGKKKLSREEMEKRVNGTGAEALLIFKVIAVDKSHHYVPPTAYISPDLFPYDWWWDDDYWGYYNPYPYSYWGYWYPAMQVVTTPGYWETSKTFVVESTLYRTSDQRMVWTGVSDTYDPSSRADLANSLAKVVLDKLEHDDLVRTK
jgi:hypothetical protein